MVLYSPRQRGMTNQQILQKAIEKAVENGWHRPKWTINAYGNRWVADIIFSHDFSKAFFGYTLMFDTLIWEDGVTKETKKEYAWTWHLKRMVLEKEPLKYLGGFLEVEE